LLLLLLLLLFLLSHSAICVKGCRRVPKTKGQQGETERSESELLMSMKLNSCFNDCNEAQYDVHGLAQ